jgi:hypothetical protein
MEKGHGERGVSVAYGEEKGASLPGGLLDAHELAERLAKSHRMPLPVERIVELAKSGHLPCWWWQDGDTMYGPFFQVAKVKEWFVRNGHVKEQPGIDFPGTLQVRVMGVPRAEDVIPRERLPPALQAMGREFYPVQYEFSGVYFLIREDRVVYVGQSVNVTSRVGSHVSEGQKRFERAIYLPVPLSDLDGVERAFIRALRPEYNGTANNGDPDLIDEEWLAKYGFLLSTESEEL